MLIVALSTLLRPEWLKVGAVLQTANANSLTMSGTSSVNFQPVQSNSESHNQRTQNDKYGLIHSDKSHLNEQWIESSINDKLKFIEQRCKKLSGRKLQTNATPIREGIVNIKPETTMADLKKLAQAYKEKYDIEIFQIYIHRDEGRVENGKFIENHHAHILANWTTEERKGKMIRLGKQDMRDIQTLTAEVLEMKRGKPSDLKHLTVTEYKAQARAKELVRKQYREQLENLEKQVAEVKENIAALDKEQASKLQEAKEIKRTDYVGVLWDDGMLKGKKNKKSFETLRTEYSFLQHDNNVLKKELNKVQESSKKTRSELTKVKKSYRELDQRYRSESEKNEQVLDRLEAEVNEWKDKRLQTEELLLTVSLENIQKIRDKHPDKVEKALANRAKREEQKRRAEELANNKNFKTYADLAKEEEQRKEQERQQRRSRGGRSW